MIGGLPSLSGMSLDSPIAGKGRVERTVSDTFADAPVKIGFRCETRGTKACAMGAIVGAIHASLAPGSTRTETDPMAEKTDFMAQAKAQMEQWTAEMKKMQDKMMEAGAQGQSQMMKQWDDMNTQRKKIEAQMEEMGKANMEAAKEVQKSMESAWKEMEKKMEDARKKMMGG